MKKTIFIVALLLTAGFGSANAATFAFSGTLTAASGFVGTLTGPGDLLNGTIDITTGVDQVSALITDPGGIPAACLFFGADTCGGSGFGFTSVPTNTLTTAGSAITGGLLQLMSDAGSIIDLNFDTLTFSLDAGALGSAAGTLDAQVVPIPAAAWLFGSALIGLAGLRRRS